MTSRVRGVLQLVVGAAVLAVVLVSVDVPQLWDRLVRSDLRLVAPAVIGLVAMHAVAALGWRSILTATSGLQIPVPEALRLHYAAQALGGITPANLGGDVYRAAALRLAGQPWAASVVPIVIQRATSYLALAFLSLLALTALASARVAAPLVASGAAVALGLGCVAILLLGQPRPLRAVTRRLMGWIARGADSTPTHLAVSNLPQASLVGVINGIAFHAGSLLLTWVLLAGVDRAAATLPILAALTVARLSIAVPVSPSGLGVQEAVVVTLVAAVGGPVEGALGGMLLARLALVLTTTIGFGLLATRPGRVPLALARH